MEYKGELIYRAEDINKYIDLMPRPTMADDNPIFHAGSTTNEQDLDTILLDEFKKTRPRKPFYRQEMGDRILFIEAMDKYQDGRYLEQL